MKKFYKIAGITAGICAVLGIIFVLIGASFGVSGVISIMKNGGFKIIDNSERYEYENMDMEAFDSINIAVDVANVTIKESEDGKYGVKADLVGDKDTVKIINENGVLMVTDGDSETRFTINLFSWNGLDGGQLIIYVPKSELVQMEEITIESNVGNISVYDICKVKNMNIVADLGNIQIEKGNYETMKIIADAGNITAEDIFIENKLDIDVDAGNIDVTGLLMCNVDIATDAGNVHVEVVDGPHYNYTISSNLGDVEAFGREAGSINGKLEGNEDKNDGYNMNITTDVGDVTLTRN